jgi:hypothetical protein
VQVSFLIATIKFGRDFGFSPTAGTVTVDIFHSILSRKNRGLGKLPLHRNRQS